MSGEISTSVDSRTVEAGRGLEWWREAWALFTKAAGLWIVLGLLLFVVLAVIGFVPLLGALASTLLIPVFLGAWMLAAKKVEGGGSLEVGDLFTTFRGDKLKPLLVIGGLLLAALLVMGVVAGALGMGALMGTMMDGAVHSAGAVLAATGAGMMALLVVLLLGVLAAMATWFAPALVVFRGMAPVDALRASFGASLKNMVPMLIYGLIYIAASVVASIPFGLGWVVLVPVTLLTVYTSYKDVYGG
jgi:uncharacterized membrane protein